MTQHFDSSVKSAFKSVSLALMLAMSLLFLLMALVAQPVFGATDPLDNAPQSIMIHSIDPAESGLIGATQVQTNTFDPGAPPASESGIVVNEVTLIDTLVEWAVRFWLCLGVLAIFATLLVFPILWLRGRQLNQGPDDF